MYALHECGYIVDKETGEVVVKDTSPKFQGWNSDDYYAEFKKNKEIRYLEPMTAREIKPGEEIPEDGYIAEEKFDGHRSLAYFTSRGVRLFSRRISKKTGWYAENTDCLPQLRECPRCKTMLGTVLDGEITMPTRVFSDIQGVTGALPATALQNQGEKGFAIFNAFDIIYYRGTNVQAMPLWKRKILLNKVVKELNSPFIREVKCFAVGKTYDYLVQDDLNVDCVLGFKPLLEDIWKDGGEGLILKDINGKYEQKRSKFFLKLKDMIYRDVVVMDYEEPTKEFEGKTSLEQWIYWEDPHGRICKPDGLLAAKAFMLTPVTKPYALEWIGAIKCGVYKDGELFEVVSLKGFTDEEQEYIKENREKLIGTVLEVKANGFSDKSKGTLRHPRFSRWREDKSAEMCTWEDHIL